MSRDRPAAAPQVSCFAYYELLTPIPVSVVVLGLCVSGDKRDSREEEGRADA